VRRSDHKHLTADATDRSPVRNETRGGDSAVKVELGDLVGYVGFHLRMAQDASFRAFARNTGQKDVKPGHFAALLVIQNNPGIGQGALGRAIARDKSTVTPLIQTLRQRGWIEIRRSASDGRRINLLVTEAGKRFLRRLQRHAQSHDRKLDVIVGGDKAKFIDLLKKIANELN
jgi:DNA-binding MarR family transcriptional regulator